MWKCGKKFSVSPVRNKKVIKKKKSRQRVDMCVRTKQKLPKKKNLKEVKNKSENKEGRKERQKVHLLVMIAERVWKTKF